MAYLGQRETAATMNWPSIDLEAFVTEGHTYTNLSDWQDEAQTWETAQLARLIPHAPFHSLSRHAAYKLVCRMSVSERLHLNEHLNACTTYVKLGSRPFVTRKTLRRKRRCYRPASVSRRVFDRAVLGMPREWADLLFRRAQARRRAVKQR